MIRVRKRERDPGESRIELQEWLCAVLALGGVLVAAVSTLGLVYLLMAAR